MDPINIPEIMGLKELISRWRFYDHFRIDADAPCRLSQLGTRTPVLSSDGHDLAAALQTITEIGDSAALHQAITDAFPGSKLGVHVQQDGRFLIKLQQHGLLRPLSAAELSDGTLRYLLWVAALLSLMVLNEPETSLHPDLVPALARLIVKVAKSTQVWVVSNSAQMIAALESAGNCHRLKLEKKLGQTQIRGQDLLNQPSWVWPDKSH
jgi:predicted ATPase